MRLSKQNEIAYEYTNRVLNDLFKDVLNATTTLFPIIAVTHKYCRENHYGK